MYLSNISVKTISLPCRVTNNAKDNDYKKLYKVILCNFLEGFSQSYQYPLKRQTESENKFLNV